MRHRIGVGAAVTALALAGLSPTAATAQAAETLTVDLASSTGAFHGGATGVLYGLGDPGVPSRDLIAGMEPRTIAQKPPDGEQHPNGDAIVVAEDFFASGGTDIYINSQDAYSAWPYQDLGIEDYAAKVRAQLDVVARRPDRDRFVWTIFNEPDWIWYGDWAGRKQKFFSDWTRIYRLVKSVLPNARIDGPGESYYNPGRLRDFFAYAAANNVLPDITTWHELSPESLNSFRAHLADYRSIERSLGISPRPVNITEYSNRRDTSVPGQMIQWISMLEDGKVDGQLAFWSVAGNLSDQAVRTARANGGWWLTKWYADLSGDTVRVTPPRPNTRDTLQGLATLDRADREATVLLGGTANPVAVAVTGIDTSVFGGTVDVRVSKVAWTGYEGDAGRPPVVAASRLPVVNGRLTVPVPGGDRLAAYRVSITPAGTGAAPTADEPWSTRQEAESGIVENAVVVTQDGDPQRYTASGGKDVGYLDKAASRVTVTATVPRDGTYRLGVIYGTGGFVGKQALYVDNAHRQDLTFPATLNWQYRGRLDTPVQLTAGTHRISLRTSNPGGFIGAPSNITLDRIDLAEVTGPERTAYPLADARRTGGTVVHTPPVALRSPRALTLNPGERATTWVSAAEDAYYALSTRWTSAGGSRVDIALSDRGVAGGELSATGGGTYEGSLTVHLRAGITKVVLTNGGSTPVTLGTLTSVRAAGADQRSVVVEAEAGLLSGGARVEASPWASRGSYVGWLGNGSTFTVPRPAATRTAGQYNLTVAYAQADKNTGHAYNTDAITRFMTAGEAGGRTTRAPYRHNYTWNGFWAETSPIDLTTASGALVFGNSTGWAPNVDWVGISPLLAAKSVTPAN
ncbi:hypothetical protein LZG04_28720 [Saccharothrix sp. S26]|uniref:hypothetical protein n=1 Tax=Saccharothrix sp. S26 TaxID=2907215 RepID=UPI001F41F05C|nr:hypothetical protein [Saccharothrix sp. S26]MCE6998750.1 hypothetical protein [Saccharothrix sp. S26]